MLLDSGVIVAGDGALFGGAMMALLLACVVVPLAFAVAWEFVVGFIEGSADD